MVSNVNLHPYNKADGEKFSLGVPGTPSLGEGVVPLPFPSLEVLQLGANNISHVPSLQLGALRNLKVGAGGGREVHAY